MSKFQDLPSGAMFNFADDMLRRLYVKVSDTMAARDGIQIKVPPSYECELPFIVYSTERGQWVEDINPWENEAQWTSDKTEALEFRSDFWKSHWQALGCKVQFFGVGGE